MRILAVATLSLLVACQTTSRQARLPPLEDEGEVLVYLQPFDSGVERVRFAIESVAIAAGSASPTPLQVVLQEPAAGGNRGQRLLARGRVAPGSYSSLQVKFGRASVVKGQADLLVPPEAVPVALAFSVGRGRATVIQLGIGTAEMAEKDFGFLPRLRAEVPRTPIAELLGFVTATRSNQVVVFEKHIRQVVGVLPTGRDPRGLTLDRLRGRLYVALSSDDQVEAIDALTGVSFGQVRMQAGDRPREVGLTQDGRVLLVLNQGSNSLAFADAGALLESARVNVGTDPVSLLVDPNGRWAWVFNRGSNSITLVDVVARAVVRTVGTEPEPMQGQLSAEGARLHVIHAGSPWLVTYSVQDYRALARTYVGNGATGVKVDPRTNLVYVAKGAEERIEVFDSNSSLSLQSIPIDGAGAYMAIDDAYNILYAVLPRGGGVAILDVASRRPHHSIEVGDEPYQVVVAGERR